MPATARHTPSGLSIPASFTAHQTEWMVRIDDAVTTFAAKIDAAYTVETFRANAAEAKASGLVWLTEFNTERADELSRGPMWLAICELRRDASGAGHGTKWMFLGDYLEMLDAELKARAVIGARHQGERVLELVEA